VSHISGPWPASVVATMELVGESGGRCRSHRNPARQAGADRACRPQTPGMVAATGIAIGTRSRAYSARRADQRVGDSPDPGLARRLVPPRRPRNPAVRRPRRRAPPRAPREPAAARAAAGTR
jgi:hypothetical protein